MQVWQAVALLLSGCFINVLTLEALIIESPGSGFLITFAQFLGISLIGFICTERCGTRRPVIPIQQYLTLVCLHFFVQVVNNQALAYHISMPLHMIIRSGSLLASLVMGIICLRRSYSLSKYISVTVVTLGITMTTLTSAPPSDNQTESSENQTTPFDQWLIGLGLVFIALFSSAGLGILQERTFLRFGKHPDEALFYSHALPIPGFLLFSSQLASLSTDFSQSAPLWGLPRLWVILLANVIAQYVGIKGVFVLTAESSALTLTLVLTLRKFLSLVFSVVYFEHPFTGWHCLGVALVFAGTLIFTDVHRYSRSVQAKVKLTENGSNEMIRGQKNDTTNCEVDVISGKLTRRRGDRLEQINRD